MNSIFLRKRAGMSPLAAVLQQQRPMLPGRPENPAEALDNGTVDPSVDDDRETGARKLTITDRSMNGDEIKMSVESNKENDSRINFLLKAFTDKTHSGEGDVPEDGSAAASEEAVIPVLPQQA